jgi:VWFA-related protein
MRPIAGGATLLGVAVLATAVPWPALTATSARPADQEPLVFRSRAAVVTVDVSVWRGRSPVRGLVADDFVVTDEGVPQTLHSLSMEDVPMDVTMFVDTSGSLSDLRLGLGRDVSSIFKLLRPIDRLRVLTLGYQVHDLFGWRSPADQPAFEMPPVGRISAVYDALWLALLRRPEQGRRHLIVALTDGDDWSSLTTSSMLLEAASRSEAVLHIVRLPSTSTDTGRPWQWSSVRPDLAGQARLAEAATRTGGRLHAAPAAGRPVVSAFTQAFDDFRQSYVLRYAYTGPYADGWHDIDVAIARPGHYTVRARQGYLAR